MRNSMGGLTPTLVLRYLNEKLGSTVQETEFTEDDMMNIVFQDTLYTYSKFFPFKYNIVVTDANYITGIKGRQNCYTIPNTDHLEIFGIHKVFLSSLENYGTAMVPLSLNPIESQMQQDYWSETITPTTWEYFPPNIIEIRPKIIVNTCATLVVKAIHPTHLKTIPLSMRDEFLQLCLDDVLLALYPIRHRFESLNTPYGNITPFMDLVDGAKADREELMTKWRENVLTSATAKRIWIG